MQCEEWADANSELFKEAHDETVHKNSYKRKLYELISASLIKGMKGNTLSGVKLLRIDWHLAGRFVRFKGGGGKKSRQHRSWDSPLTLSF